MSGDVTVPGRNAGRALLAAVLSIGLGLRLWGSMADLPLVFHSDEPTNLAIVHRIFTTGDLNPRFFQYPSFFFYLHAVAYVPYYVVGHLLGVFNSVDEVIAPVSLVMGTTLASVPSAVVLSRLLSIGTGLGCIAVVHVIGTTAGQTRPIALLGALLTAVSPTLIDQSISATPDILVTFWVLAAAWAALWIVKRGTGRDYALAGLAAGLAAGSKYNGAMALTLLGAAHLLRPEGWTSGGRRLAGGLACAAAAFLATTPFAAIDAAAFVRDVAFEARHYATGHDGMEGDSVRWYVQYLWRTEGLIAAAAAVQGVRALASRSPHTRLIAIFTVTYLSAIAFYVVRNERTVLPALPFLHLLAAWLLADLARHGARWRSPAARRAAVAACLVAAAVFVVRPVRVSAEDARRRSAIDGRSTARVWINEHLPAGSTIALESYSPFLDGSRFTLRPVTRLIDHDAAWYREQRVDYLVFSWGMFGRYYREPGKYPDEKAAYDDLFRQFARVRSFDEDGFEVRLHRVPAP